MNQFRIRSNYRYRSQIEMEENQITFHLALNDARTGSPQIFNAYNNFTIDK